AGLLYDRPDFYNGGYTNHALHVTGIMRDFHAVEEVLGVFVNDGNHVLGGTLLSRERMTLAFEEAYRATIETVRMRGSESPAS
ncbi:MAG: hypothetical protein J2P36_07105, partial [Ktedonobacteraceae bacterium]|nr:hypothetical protein [Ktedonobacteraceae bacterium]